MRKIFILFILFFSTVYIIKAQDFVFSDNCKNAYIKITALEFDKGLQFIKSERHQNPDNVLPVLYENYIDFLRVIIGEQKNDYESFKDSKRKRIRNIRDGDKKSPYYLYSLANINLHYAFARLRFNDYFTALFEIKRAFHLLERNVEKYPDFIPNNIGFGLLHTLVGSIPENYKWVSWLASMDGTVEQGFKELFLVLNESQANPAYAHLLNEAAFFLTFLEMNISSDRANSDRFLSILNKQANEQPLIVFAKLSVLTRTARNDEAIRIMDEYIQSDTSYPFHYLTYIRGLLYLNQLNPKATIYFQNYIDAFNGGSYIKSAYQKMAWLALIQDGEEEYKRLIAFCKTQGNDLLDGDEQAEKEAENQMIPQGDLLKARLLYDGGYYLKSLHILTDSTLQISGFNLTELSEYYYRMGRNYQALEQFESAIRFFKMAVEKGKDLPAYFAGNSVLQLGMIYENHQEFAKAAFYFNTCLDLDFKTYKRSLDVKAKAGLSRLETKKGTK